MEINACGRYGLLMMRWGNSPRRGIGRLAHARWVVLSGLVLVTLALFVPGRLASAATVSASSTRTHTSSTKSGSPPYNATGYFYVTQTTSLAGPW